jgi:DNA-binding response OmpR family regulator
MSDLIYIAEHDVATGRRIQAFLENIGLRAQCFASGDLLYETFQHQPCKLAILGTVMPGSDGFVIGAKIRQHGDTPVILLAPTALGEDHAFSQSLGMDAYLSKPLCMSKLLTYVKALLIKAQPHKLPVESTPVYEAATQGATHNPLAYADVAICLDRRVAVCNDTMIALTGTELKLLQVLVARQECAVPRSELLDKIWGKDNPIGPRATDDIVKRLRKKLKDAGSQVSIDTVWGFGFRLDAH